MVTTGQKPTKEQIKQIRAIAKKPVNFTEDCPESSPEALVEFAKIARELRKNRRSPARVVALRLMPDVLEKYKSLGKGYTGIMADVLTYAASHPDYLKQATL
jgi:uncharacterized protein (DUF4415 family)